MWRNACKTSNNPWRVQNWHLHNFTLIGFWSICLDACNRFLQLNLVTHCTLTVWPYYKIWSVIMKQLQMEVQVYLLSSAVCQARLFALSEDMKKADLLKCCLTDQFSKFYATCTCAILIIESNLYKSIMCNIIHTCTCIKNIWCREHSCQNITKSNSKNALCRAKNV